MTDSNFNTTDGTTPVPVPGTDVTDTNQPGLHQEDININIDTTIPGYPEGSADTTFTVDYGDTPLVHGATPVVNGLPTVDPSISPALGQITDLLTQLNGKLDVASHEEEHSAAGHDPIYDVLNVLWEIKASIDHTNQHHHDDAAAAAQGPDPVLDALNRIEDKLNRTFNS